MKKTVHRSQFPSGQQDLRLGRWRFVLLMSGLMFGWLTLGCSWLTGPATGNAFHLLAYFLGMLATGALLGWLALLVTPDFRRESAFPSDRVLTALRATLTGPTKDADARVRAEAAKGLAALDVEQSALHQGHQALDTLLIATLVGPQKDPDAAVRFEAAKGLAALEAEQHSYHHSHHELDEVLFEQDL